MIVKFLPNKKGGSVKSIDYLLNERKEQGTARIIKGNEKITRDLINSLSFKQKATVGVLSFEEENISEEAKQQIIKEFEFALAPGMKNRLNFLWVEHTDKGRLELNFVIPKIDLESGKSYNTFYYKKDTKRIDAWKDTINIRYNLTNPKEPKKERNTSTDKTQSKDFNLNYEELDKFLKSQVLEGKIKNRSELIKFLEDKNIEVKRQGKDYISVKFAEHKKAKRFKNSIYSQDFKSLDFIKNLEEEKEIKQENFIKSTTQDKEKTLKELQKKLYIEKKKRFIFNRKRYGKKDLKLENELNEILRKEKEKKELERKQENGRVRDFNNRIRERINAEKRINSRINEYKHETINGARKRQERTNRELNNRIEGNRSEISRFTQYISGIADTIRRATKEIRKFIPKSLEELAKELIPNALKEMQKPKDFKFKEEEKPKNRTRTRSRNR